MSNRLDQDREAKLQPRRMQYAQEHLRSHGYTVTKVSKTEIQITHKGEIVRIFPYSGWFTGKSVKDDRGIHNLLKQLKP